MAKIKRKCKVLKCGYRHEAMGYCAAHYYRVQSLGEKEGEKPIRRRGEYDGRAALPEYRVWTNIKQRCLNKKHPQYKDYGGRGIKLYRPWVQDFKAFYEHIGARSDKKLTIERIDNNLGYIPGNVTWASRSVQVKNRRPYSHAVRIDKFKIKMNKYLEGKIGVTFKSRERKYIGQVTHNGKRLYLGSYLLESDAREAVAKFAERQLAAKAKLKEKPSKY